MNKLIKVGERTYYISGPFHIGVYVLDDGYKSDNKNRDDSKTGVCLIDSGVDRVVAKVVDKLLIDNNFEVRLIINTHYHADHSGGNAYFKAKYGCKIVATKINAALVSNYDICPAIIWGAAPINEILNNYFYATPTDTEDIENIELPGGLEYIELPGHCISMICVRTCDDILFLGDAVVSRDTLEKHPLSYIYEIGSYLKSLDKLKKITAKIYIPYHAEPVKHIRNLVKANRQCVLDNIELIREICLEPRDIDEIISMYFNRKELKLSLYKYAVEGGIIRTYITYLHNNGELEVENVDNFIRWRTIPKGFDFDV